MKLKVERKNIRRIIEIALGIILYSVEFNLIISPLNIVVGGSSGLAVLIRHIFGIDASTFITVFYVAMILLNLLVYGFKDTKQLLLGSILYPIAIKSLTFLPSVINLEYSNKLLFCLLSGILHGIASGLTYKNNFYTGGTDIPKKIISDKLKIPMGTSTIIFDGTLVVLGGFIFGLNSVLYAIIILYIISKVIDKIMLGISNKKIFYIMTSKADEVRAYIRDELKCGITEIDAVGAYDEKKHNMLMCVISTRDYVKLKTRVTQIDKDVFFIITDSYHTHKNEVKYGTN